MFPLTGSLRQPGGNGFPFIIFFLAVLTQVGLAAPRLEQYVHRSYPCLWWLSRVKGVSESSPKLWTRQVGSAGAEAVSSVFPHCAAGAILAPAGPATSAALWSLVLPEGVRVISATSQAALLGHHPGVACLPSSSPCCISRAAAAVAAGLGICAGIAAVWDASVVGMSSKAFSFLPPLNLLWAKGHASLSTTVSPRTSVVPGSSS